jgi:hypothetical protein
MRSMVFAAVISLGTIALSAPSTAGPAFKWVKGKVTSITAQLPQFTVANVGGSLVRFCNPTNGKDFAVNADNMHYDMLRSALLIGKSVEVGVTDFGSDPQSGSEKLCIDRVILRE